MNRTSVLDRLQANLEEQQRLVKDLRVWAILEAQGFTPEQVESLTFRDEYLNTEQKTRRTIAFRQDLPDPFTDGSRIILFFNAVLLKDGTVKKLDPPVEKHRD